MNQIVKFLFIASFFISTVFLPWWFSVILAVALLSVWQAYVSVIAGALVLDILFGSPLVAFGGFVYLYTAIFLILVAFTFFLNRAMLE